MPAGAISPLPAFEYGDEIGCFVHYLAEDISGHGLPQRRKRKYAANSKHAEHTGMPQRLYLQFLCAKRAVCSGVPKFAAYFRVVIPEVRGKIEIGRPDPGFALP